jgi:hypothetical protein
VGAEFHENSCWRKIFSFPQIPPLAAIQVMVQGGGALSVPLPPTRFLLAMHRLRKGRGISCPGGI